MSSRKKLLSFVKENIQQKKVSEKIQIPFLIKIGSITPLYIFFDA
jgi:hypothetical protein